MSREEIKARISELKTELEKVEGKRGICSQCGKEEFYANWGPNDEAKICVKCYDDNEIKKERINYVHLIGLKVEDVIISADYYPFQGLKLEGGIMIEVGRDYDGGAHLHLSAPSTKSEVA